MVKREKIKVWVKDHKKHVIAASIGIVTCTGILIGLKNKSVLESALNKYQLHDISSKLPKGQPSATPMIQYDQPAQDVIVSVNDGVQKCVFEVKGHVRNLSGGRHPSQMKMEIAKSQGIELLENQTLVNPYIKGLNAA